MDVGTIYINQLLFAIPAANKYNTEFKITPLKIALVKYLRTSLIKIEEN